MNQLVQDILGHIDESREEIAELTLELANTYAPVLHEQAVAEVVNAWYERNGIESRVVPIIEDRANVVAKVRGNGTGKDLVFNAHLDTETSGEIYDTLMGGVPDPNKVGGWREGDALFGHMVLNDRHAHSLMMMTARAIQKSGYKLQGDLILTSVAGETGNTPIDEFKGKAYEGKGFGTKFLVDHGVRGHYAIISETSDFTPCWHANGAAYFKISIGGRNMYTPRLQRPANGELNDHPNAIVKAGAVIDAVEAWAIDYERRRTHQTPCGENRPTAQIGAVRGGIPYRPNRSSTHCALYVDVRLVPGEDPLDARQELRQAVASTGVDADVELIMSKAGALGQNVEPLVDAIRASHVAIRGTEAPTEAEPAVVSMWRDQNIFNNAGIPAVNFGPPRGSAAVQGTGSMDLTDMVDATKMYALTTLMISGGLSSEDIA